MNITTDIRFYDFSPFRLDLTSRLLLRAGEPVPLTPKAFETLLVLVRNNGRIVKKDELLKSVWSETYVEEATLAQNIFTIRQALGGSNSEQYIQTIPKRGYRFVANVTEVVDESAYGPIDEFGTATEIIRHGENGAREGAFCSVAVLPLNNAMANVNAELLSDGICESIVEMLSLFPKLRIKACSCVLHYKGRELDPQKAGRELGVDAVLVGRIHQFGENVSIRVELVQVTNGWQIWSEEYSEKLSDITGFREMVAKDISEKLCLRLTGERPQRLFRSGARRAEAHQFYLQGRAFLNTRTKEGYKKAIDCFEHAIDIDSSSALAYSGLADSYTTPDFYGITTPWDVIQKARKAAARAIEIDNELAEAHTSLAAIKLIYDRDLEEAEREFKRAIWLNPKYSRAHDGYAQCLLEMGQIEESLAECNLALELDPLDLEINQHLGWYYVLTDQTDLAIEQLNKTLALGSDLHRARILLGIAYGKKKLFSEAIAEFLRASAIEKTAVLSGFLGYAYAMAGKREAQDILHYLLEKSKHEYVPPYSLALIYTGLGKEKKALEWLEKAFIEQSHWRGWPYKEILISLGRFPFSEVRVAGVPGNTTFAVSSKAVGN